MAVYSFADGTVDLTKSLKDLLISDEWPKCFARVQLPDIGDGTFVGASLAYTISPYSPGVAAVSLYGRTQTQLAWDDATTPAFMNGAALGTALDSYLVEDVALNKTNDVSDLVEAAYTNGDDYVTFAWVDALTSSSPNGWDYVLSLGSFRNNSEKVIISVVLTVEYLAANDATVFAFYSGVLN